VLFDNVLSSVAILPKKVWSMEKFWGESLAIRGVEERAGGSHVDVASNCQDAAELGDLAELQRQPADDGIVQGVARVDPKLAGRVHLRTLWRSHLQ